jgi:hypothetical protein
MRKPTVITPDQQVKTARHPWDSWGDIARYLVLFLGLGMLAVLLTWLATLLH